MNFTEFKDKCSAYNVFVLNGLTDDSGKKFDKCKLTGARCMRKKCPGFQKSIEHTDMLQSDVKVYKESPIDIYQLRGEYEEEMVKGE